MKIIIFLIIFCSLSFTIYSDEFTKLIENKKYDSAIKYLESSTHNNIIKSDNYNTLGLHLLNNNNISDAKNCFMTSVVLNPNNYKAFLYLGIISFNENNLNKSLHEFNKAIDLNSKLSTAHYYLGKIYTIKGNFNNAEQHFIKAYNLNPVEPDILSDLLSLYHKIRNFQNYIEYSKIYIDLNSVDINEKIKIIKNVLYYYSNISNFNMLSRYYDSLSDELKYNPNIIIFISEIYYNNNNFNKAKNFLLQLEDSDTYTYSTKKNYLLGNIYYHENKFASSLNHFNKYLETNSADTTIVYILFNIYKNLKDFDNFEKCFQLLLDNSILQSLDKNTVYSGIEFLLNNKRYIFLKKLFNKFDKLYYKDERFINLKISFLKSNLLINELYDFFEEIKIHIKSDTLILEYIDFLLYTANFNELKNCLTIHNNFSSNNLELEINKIKGYLYFINNSYDSALIFWNKYLTNNPKEKDINFYISQIYKSDNSLNQERQHLLAEFENNPYNYFNLKRIIENSLSLGDIKRAEFHALVMLSIDTSLEFPIQTLIDKNLYYGKEAIFQALNIYKNTINLSYTKNYLLKTYSHAKEEIKRGKYENGLKYLNNSLYIPENKISEYYFYKALAHLKLNKYIYAYIYFNLSNIYEKNIPSLYNLAFLNKHLKKYDEALDFINIITNLKPDANNWIDLMVLEAKILFYKKDYKEAAIQFLTLQKYGYEFANYFLFKINYNLGNLNYLNGNYKLAITYFKNCLNYEIEHGLIFFKIGNAYYKLNNFQLAKQNYDKALYYNYTNDNIYNNLGLINLLLNNRIEANQFFKKSGKLILTIENQIITQIKELINIHSFKEAEKLLNDIENTHEKELQSNFLKLLQNKQIDLTFINNIELNKIVSKDIYYYIKFLERINNNDYANGLTYFNYAYSFSNYSNYYLISLIKQLINNNVSLETSLKYINEINNFDNIQNKSFIYFLTGNLYFYHNEYLRAYQFYKRTINLDNSNNSAKRNLILALYQLKRYDNALVELNNSDLSNEFKYLMLTLLFQKKELYLPAYDEYLKFEK